MAVVDADRTRSLTHSLPVPQHHRKKHTNTPAEKSNMLLCSKSWAETE